jgi:hypothetical protein
MCHVAPRTVSKWCDEHGLEHYRLPGGNDRRIMPDKLREFLNSKGIPVPAEIQENAT